MSLLTHSRRDDERRSGRGQVEPAHAHAEPVRRPRRVARYGLYGLVLAGLATGSLQFMHDTKTVELRVDGQVRTVHTSATDVRGVLASAKIKVGEHDLLAPGLDSGIHGGSAIVLRRGHLLDLNVDGNVRNIWVNADSVDEALDQLGFGSNSFVSVSRSKRLDAGATQLAIFRPKKVTVKVDGQAVELVSAGPTVGDALVDAGIVLGPNDRLSAGVKTELVANETIKIQRVRYGRSVSTIVVPFATVTRKDPTSYAGTSAVTTSGQNGQTQVTYQVVYVDGKLSGRVVSETDVLTAPVDQVTSVGSKPIPPVVPAGTAQQIAAGMVTARGWGNDQFSCLVSLWSRESGWRTDAANSSGAYGIPQALPGGKMASAGADWETNPATQITWGLNYIAGVYGTPCAAWGHSQSYGWY